MKKIFTITGLTIIAALTLQAQDMKKIDVQILAQGSAFLHGTGGGDRQVLYVAPELQVQYNFNRFFSAGIVYTRAVADWPDIYLNDNLEVPREEVTSDYQALGIIAKASTNRVRRLRFYVLAYASMTEMADHFNLSNVEDGSFTVSRTGWSYGAGFGLSVKVTRSFALNLFEVKASYNSGTLSYIDENRPYYGLNMGIGLNFLFLREK